MTNQRTQERLIATGLHLFYQQGFHATGLDQILDEVGITKTTFYRHFESKEDLALACIEHRDAMWRAKFPRLLRERAGDDPVDQLREVFGVWRDWFSDLHFNGCLFMHACSEFPSVADPCHLAARANFNALRNIVRDLAEDAGFVDPDDFAEQFDLLMQGSIIVEVIDRRGRSAETAGRLADLLIERSLPTPV